MANSDLYGTIIGEIPIDIINFIKQFITHNKDVKSLDTYGQAISFINNPELSYSQAKKLKNYFDDFSHLNDDRKNYDLLGGKKMENFINRTLKNSRNNIKRRKIAKSMVFNNQFRKSHNKTRDNAYQTGNLTNLMAKNNNYYLKENDEITKRKESAIGFIFNDNDELLIVQRCKTDKWMPMKWALVGGTIENGETPEEAFEREAFEEVNAKLENIEHMFDKDEENCYVYMFKAICTNPDEIKVDKEHEKFKWIDSYELEKFNIVPDLLDDLEKVLNPEEDLGNSEQKGHISEAKFYLDENYERTKNGKVKYHNEIFPGINKPKRAPKGSKYKYRVLAKDGDKVSIVNFGARGYKDFLQHKDPKRRRNFRARMKCHLKYSKLTAKYWVCHYNW